MYDLKSGYFMRKTLSQEPLHDTVMCRVGLFLCVAKHRKESEYVGKNLKGNNTAEILPE